MNIPNRLSILRIVLIPVFVVLFFLPFPWLRFAALGVFIIASVTDMLDGYIARKYNMCTDVGNFLDTIADKMLVVCSLISISVSLTLVGITNNHFWHYQSYPPNYFRFESLFLVAAIVCTMIIVSRELLISGLKMMAQTKNVTIVADKLGKAKMTMQVIALIFLIPHGDISRLNDLAGIITLSVGSVLLVAATVLTVISCINYLIKYRYVFSTQEEDKTEANKMQENDAPILIQTSDDLAVTSAHTKINQEEEQKA